MNESLKIEDHINFIRKFAHKVCVRLRGTGTVTVSFEDVVQELSVAWCQARDHWDETTGVPFIAYLKRGMIHHINRWVGHEVFHYNASHFELDAELPNTNDGHSLIADRKMPSAEDEVAFKQGREKALEKLSPRARQFVEFVETPPKCLVDLIKGMRDRRLYAVSRGLRSPATPKRVLTSMVFGLMGASRLERTRITKELEEKFNIKAALSDMDGVADD